MSDDPSGLRRASDSTGSTAGLDALTDEILPALIARLRASRLAEIEVASAGWRVRLRRDSSTTQGSGASRQAASAASGATSSETNGSVASSPAVGYFKPASNLAIGQAVQAGDSLGSVDVLGISHDVPAPSDGIVMRVLAEADQAVEYGQALAHVDPLDADLEIAAGDGSVVVD